MTKPSLRFMRNQHIEDVTASRIRRYEEATGTAVGLPVPVEEIVEQALGLNISWERIEEHPGELILAGLRRRTQTVVMNEAHLDLFDANPGLLNSTLAHEAGHADLEGDLGDRGPGLFGGDAPRVVDRQSSRSDGAVAVLLDLALRNEHAYRLLRKITEGQDTPEQRSAVDRYQSALLMPKWLLAEATLGLDLTRWPTLYRLRDAWRVTISNLVTRLSRLEMIFIPAGTTTIYRSRTHSPGSAPCLSRSVLRL